MQDMQIWNFSNFDHDRADHDIVSALTFAAEVTKVFDKPLTESEEKIIVEVLGEYDCLFTDINSVNELFEFEDEDSLNCDSEGLNRVLEFVK